MQRAHNHAIPNRMARAMDGLFEREGAAKHAGKQRVLDDLKADDQRIPLAHQTTGAPTAAGAIWCAADEAARECMSMFTSLQTMDAVLIALNMICQRRGVPFPAGETEQEIIKRALDKGWWRRMLRKEFMRRFEHTAIHLGLTGLRTDPYITRETAIMQETQNRENAKMLADRTVTNENGQSYTVAELAALGMGNKALRRGELMTRINGFEVVAKQLGHVAMFGTVTCPGEFHSVGGTNEKYNGASPRDGQAHLVRVMARYRSAMARAGIPMYGFRIAEPHTDACPHWHTLLFIDDKLPGKSARSAYARASALMRRYALGQGEREAPKRADIVRRLRAQGRLLDGAMTYKEAGALADIELHEWRVSERARQNAAPGAKKNRVKIVRIDPAKGSAAGYIIKYVAKNIDGEGVGAHQVKEGGQTYYVAPDLFGDVQITPSQRVTYWSQVWGIRQFQQIGGAPVGVWRELRRVKAETVQNAPATIKAAHLAVQAIKSKDIAVAKQASWADYLWAQGGPVVGRSALIKIASREITVVGRYATYEAEKPVGVYLASQEEAVYESVRYRWTVSGGSGGVAFDLPRTGVNNCTGAANSLRGADGNFPVLKKNSLRDRWSRSGNSGRDDGGQVWSKREDRQAVESYKARSKKHGETHLEQLQRKYAERGARNVD